MAGGNGEGVGLKKWAYYNDNDPYVCEWARNLIRAGLVMDGEVDERPIQDVQAADLVGFLQCHFFSGILGWPHALNLAGWEGPVWTGSCPCQPLSSAGQRKGHADERHLWPAFHDLIAECSPPVVFGEQVASKDGREWLAGIRADLEQLGYAVGAADLPSAGVGAPHIRQRLWWVADAQDTDRRTRERREKAGTGPDGERRRGFSKRGADRRLADAERNGGRTDQPGRQAQGRASDRGTGGGLGDAAAERRQNTFPVTRRGNEGSETQGGAERSADDSGADGLADTDGTESRRRELRLFKTGRGGDGPSGDGQRTQNGFWADHDLTPCADGKARRIEPGIQPLAHGIPARVGKLRAAGNAIVPQVAAEFVKAVMTV